MFEILLLIFMLVILVWIYLVDKRGKSDKPPIINVHVHVSDSPPQQTTDNLTTYTKQAATTKKTKEIPIEEPDRESSSDWINIKATDSNI